MARATLGAKISQCAFAGEIFGLERPIFQLSFPSERSQPGETAIAWALRHPAVTGAILGARNSKQVDGVIGAMDFRLTPSEMPK